MEHGLPPDLVALEPVLTPRGQLVLRTSPEAGGIPAAAAARLLDAFERGSGDGLLQLGAGEVSTLLPPALGYWRDFAVAGHQMQ